MLCLVYFFLFASFLVPAFPYSSISLSISLSLILLVISHSFSILYSFLLLFSLCPSLFQTFLIPLSWYTFPSSLSLTVCPYFYISFRFFPIFRPNLSLLPYFYYLSFPFFTIFRPIIFSPLFLQPIFLVFPIFTTYPFIFSLCLLLILYFLPYFYNLSFHCLPIFTTYPFLSSLSSFLSLSLIPLAPYPYFPSSSCPLPSFFFLSFLNLYSPFLPIFTTYPFLSPLFCRLHPFLRSRVPSRCKELIQHTHTDTYK